MNYELSGVVYDGEYTSNVFYKNATFAYQIHIPLCCQGIDDCGLIVTHDGLNAAEAAAVELLQKSGKAPACITIGISPGNLCATSKQGESRNLRFNTYDISTGHYANFVVDELLPYLIQKYNLKISASPDLHMVTGGSSGGICAWNFAWHRNDYFRRVYASSPTFSALGNGEIDPFLIRKYEPKPIRVFTDYSEIEPDNYFGSSFIAAENFEKALSFANYAFKSEYHPGEDHCSRRENYEYSIYKMLYLWENWQSEPIGVNGLSTSIETIITHHSHWQETDGYSFQDHTKVLTPLGEYSAKGNCIRFTQNGTTSVISDAFEDISAIALSCDKWRMYIADRKRRCIYAASIAENGLFDGIYLFASLHIPTEFQNPGIYDMYVDSEDRIYAVTELGIQCVRSYGLVDAILQNPGTTVPKKIELDMWGNLNVLSGQTYFMRPLNGKKPNVDGQIRQPKQASY